MDTDSKRCSKCGEVKLLSSFYLMSANKQDGHGRWCKVCASAANVKHGKAWRENNHEQFLATRRAYNARPEVREREQARQNKRLKENPEARLTKRIRTRMYQAVQTDSEKDGHTTDLLECSWDQYFGHIEINFEEGMTWDNYGKVWEVDHIRPIASFDLSDSVQQRKAFHWKNTRPLWKKENRAKSAKWDGVTNA